MYIINLENKLNCLLKKKSGKELVKKVCEVVLD